MTSVERLTDHVFDGPAAGDRLAAEVADWLAGSRRFRAFVDTHRDKIRKKLRGASDAGSRRDLRAELRAAHLLLADRRIELAFEAYGSARGGPDFTVTFRAQLRFNLEVTRPHAQSQAVTDGGPILPKLRQLPPSVPNALLVAIDGDDAAILDVPVATRTLLARAEARDDAFFRRRGLDGTRAFHQGLLRLGAVLVWCDGAVGEARATVWHNRSARIAVPERAARACLEALRAG